MAWTDKLIITPVESTPKGERVLKLSGPLTLTTLFDFQDAVRAEQAPRLIFDFSEVPYVDSAGVGVLVNAHVSRVNAGKRLALVAVAERVQTLLAATHVDQVLAIFPSLPEAAKQLTD
jgi:anti-anti-sigma factor